MSLQKSIERQYIRLWVYCLSYAFYCIKLPTNNQLSIDVCNNEIAMNCEAIDFNPPALSIVTPLLPTNVTLPVPNCDIWIDAPIGYGTLALAAIVTVWGAALLNVKKLPFWPVKVASVKIVV